jgi:hypothetical protein
MGHSPGVKPGASFQYGPSGSLPELPADEFPHMAEHVRQHMSPAGPDDQNDFAFGLDLILDGLERLLVRGA